VPAPDRGRAKPARRVRCESCLEVLSLRHAWDVAGCSCGALLVSGRPTRPTVSWLSRRGGGWTELEDEIPAVDGPAEDTVSAENTGDEQGKETGVPVRRLGYSRPRMAVPVEEIHPPVALTQASLASGT
jgi:hypothetical protein